MANEKPSEGLKCTKLSIRFGGINALDNVTFQVRPREIVSMIGPNGSGKTTILNCVSRIYDPSSGDLSFNGVNLLEKKAYDFVSLGISRTFQNLSLFPTMTVRDNLLVGQHFGFKSTFAEAGFRTPEVVKFERQVRERAQEMMKMLDLEDYKLWPVVALPYGIRKRIDIAKALIANPTLLLLDEPASGLSTEDVEDLSDLIVRLNEDHGVAILLVEHNLEWVMEVSDRVIALNYGKIIADGPPIEIQQNKEVIESYLGIKS